MPRRYKLGPEGEMRRAWGGKLPEEFDQRDMLAFMAETDLQLQGRYQQKPCPRYTRQATTIWAGRSSPGPERRKKI